MDIQSVKISVVVIEKDIGNEIWYTYDHLLPR